MNIDQIKYSHVSEYQRIIRSLADQGRNYYYKYLISPISAWTTIKPEEPLDYFYGRIQEARMTKDYLKIAEFYKKAISRATASDQLDLSIPGNICLDFIKEIELNTKVAESIPAIEFFNILYKPFKDYSEFEYISLNRKFQAKIEQTGKEEAENLIARKHDDSAINNEDQKSLLSQLKEKIFKKNPVEAKKEIISFLLKFSSPDKPELHKITDSLFNEIENLNKGFKKDCYDAVAVIIYRELMKTIKTSQYKKAVVLIAKYTVLFRGNPNTPYYHEIDQFEKLFISLIEKNDLWELI